LFFLSLSSPLLSQSSEGLSALVKNVRQRHDHATGQTTPPPKKLVLPTKSRLSWLLLPRRHPLSQGLSVCLCPPDKKNRQSSTTNILERRLGAHEHCMHSRLTTYSSPDCSTAASDSDLRLRLRNL